MIGAYDLTSNLTTCVEPILTAVLENYSQHFEYNALYRSHLGYELDLLELEIYDGTKVVHRVWSPSKLSKYMYMFKNSEVCWEQGHGR